MTKIKRFGLPMLACVLTLSTALLAAESASTYSETLKAAVLKVIGPDIKGTYYFPNPSVSGGIVRNYRPAEGLDKPEMVPFLIDVMLHGPDWNDEASLTSYDGMLPHLARCAAAANLGALRDPRGFEPLVEVFLHGTFQEDKQKITYRLKDEYDIRVTAARSLGYMKDPRAVDVLLGVLKEDVSARLKRGIVVALGDIADVRATEPLLETLKDTNAEESLREECLKSLPYIRDMRSLPVILEVAEQSGGVWSVGVIFPRITRVKLEIEESPSDNGVTVREFPELGKVSSANAVWRHWYSVAGKEYTKRQFDEACQASEALSKRSDKETPGVKLQLDNEKRRIQKLGVAALPLMVRRIEQGDVALIPQASDLTGGQLKENATIAETLDWWSKNKDRWTIFDFGQRGPADAMGGAPGTPGGDSPPK